MNVLKKTILVVGGSSGIGRATSIYLSKLSARVLITGRTESHINETKTLLPGAEFVLIDLPKDAEKLVKWVSEEVETIDGIVFSQGIIFTEPFETFRDYELEMMWKVNVEVSFKILRDLLPLFKNGGSVVFISSIDAFFKERAPSAGYALTKSAIIGLTNSLSSELGKYKIRVNSVSPGLIRTHMTEDFFTDEFELERKQFLERVPLGREGNPDEVARLIAFLLSDDASYISGDNIFIDGGYHTG
ncbi:MAG: SDR family oxidoreductase [Candidatus Atribacteria bacterium]|nr:SDR family oxidoreductase [Candidatus Atribacteria bacterium]